MSFISAASTSGFVAFVTLNTSKRTPNASAMGWRSAWFEMMRGMSHGSSPALWRLRGNQISSVIGAMVSRR